MYIDNVLKYKQTQTAFQPQRNNLPSPLLVDLLSKERVGVEVPQGIRNMAAANAEAQAEAQQPQQPVYAAGAA